MDHLTYAGKSSFTGTAFELAGSSIRALLPEKLTSCVEALVHDLNHPSTQWRARGIRVSGSDNALTHEDQALQ